MDKSTYEPLSIFETLFNILSALFSIVGCILTFIKFNVWLTALLVIFSIPSFYLKIKLNKAYHEFLKDSTMNNRQTWYYFSLMTQPRYPKEIRMFNLFNYFKSKRENLFNKFLDGHYKYSRKDLPNSSNWSLRICLKISFVQDTLFFQIKQLIEQISFI